MKMLIKRKTTISKKDNLILVCNSNSKLSKFNLSKEELSYIKKEQKNNQEIIPINQYYRYVFIVTPKKENNKNKNAENCRMLGNNLAEKLKNIPSALIIDVKKNQLQIMQISEGLALANYTFTKHKTKCI